MVYKLLTGKNAEENNWDLFQGLRVITLNWLRKKPTRMPELSCRDSKNKFFPQDDEISHSPLDGSVHGNTS
jgi:hypothetical protein